MFKSHKNYDENLAIKNTRKNKLARMLIRRRSGFCLIGSHGKGACKLDEKLTPIYYLGQPVMEPVGSKSVRSAIEKYQPKLGLFGHIHEAYGFVKIGRILCLNPGSEYDRGIFRGYLVDLNKDKIEKFWRVEG